MRSIVFSALLLLVAVGCTTSVFETEQISRKTGIACETAMGGYYLPKALVHLKVNKAPDTTKQRGFVVADGSFTQDWVSDRRQLYCLDYLASPNSQDTVIVNRDERGLLKLVKSDVKDRTVEIVDTLVKTATEVAKIVARSGEFEADAGETMDIQFDPFNPFEMKRINASLRRFGLCVYVEGHSFDEHVIPPEYWCANPQQDVYVNPFNHAMAMNPVMSEATTSGILYRPNQTHNVVIRRKADPSGREPWSLYMSRRMEMPNVSPVLQLGVDRALFARRQTTLTFNNGVLLNVTVDKESELERFVQIPLKIVTAVADLPAQIVQIKIVNIKGEADLLDAQGKLIQAMKTYQDTVTPKQTGSVTTGQVLGGCLQTGAPTSDCRSAAFPDRRAQR